MGLRRHPSRRAPLSKLCKERRARSASSSNPPPLTGRVALYVWHGTHLPEGAEPGRAAISDRRGPIIAVAAQTPTRAAAGDSSAWKHWPLPRPSGSGPEFLAPLERPVAWTGHRPRHQRIPHRPHKAAQSARIFEATWTAAAHALHIGSAERPSPPRVSQRSAPDRTAAAIRQAFRSQPDPFPCRRNLAQRCPEPALRPRWPSWADLNGRAIKHEPCWPTCPSAASTHQSCTHAPTIERPEQGV